MRKASKLKASIAMFAMAFGLVTASALQAAPSATASASCPPYVFLGVHGTNEETDVIGATLAGLYIQVTAHTGLPKQGLTGWSDDTSLLNDMAAGFAEVHLDGDYSALRTAYLNLEPKLTAGVTDLYTQISGEEAACNNQIHFILAGFSQGAMVVQEFAQQYSGMAGKQVSGIILYGDPLFDGDFSTSFGADAPSLITELGYDPGFISTAGWLGVFLSPAFPLTLDGSIPAAWNGRLDSYCTTDDPICNFQSNILLDVLGNHGDENQVPAIQLGAEAAIDADGSGWAASVYDDSSAPFYTTWQNDGGVSGFLSQPSTDPTGEPGGGLVQFFSGSTCGSSSGSAIMWSPSTGTHTMSGCLYNAFMTKYGGPGGTYGYPTTDQEATPNGTGLVNYMSGTACGSTESGSGLFYSSATGTWPVKGCIYQKYKSIGQDKSGIGLPTSGENSVTGGVQQNFSNGSITDIGGTITVTIKSSGGSALDNTDPYASNCVTSSYPKSVVLQATDGPTVIDLEWSNHCGTNWTQVTPNTGNGNGAIEMLIWVERKNSNGTITVGDQFEFPPNGSTIGWSNQLYAPTQPARACEQYWVRATKTWSTEVCTAWSAAT
jgi:Cutinase/LGFP repeat/Protein of unknown function (DUF2690)